MLNFLPKEKKIDKYFLQTCACEKDLWEYYDKKDVRA